MAVSEGMSAEMIIRETAPSTVHRHSVNQDWQSAKWPEVSVTEFNRGIAHQFLSPLCSIVCTTYNHAKYCLEAIESIVNQSYRPVEIIVVDDGSTDETVDVVKRALQESRLPSLLIEKPNDGNVSRNANIALAHAKGDIVVLFSLDDLLLPRCVSGAMSLFAQDSKLVLVGSSSISEISESGRVMTVSKQLPLFENEAKLPEFLLELEFSSVGSYFLQGTAFRKEFLDQLGGFDERSSGDDLPFRTKVWRYLAERKDLRYAFLKEPTFAYRRSKKSLNNRSLRQVMTVIDWRDLYFPERDLPPIAITWIRRAFSDLETSKGAQQLRATVKGNPYLESEYAKYQRSWLRRRRIVKARVRSLLLAIRPDARNV